MPDLASQLSFESWCDKWPTAHVLRLLLTPDKLCNINEMKKRFAYAQHYHDSIGNKCKGTMIRVSQRWIDVRSHLWRLCIYWVPVVGLLWGRDTVPPPGLSLCFWPPLVMSLCVSAERSNVYQSTPEPAAHCTRREKYTFQKKVQDYNTSTMNQCFKSDTSLGLQQNHQSQVWMKFQVPYQLSLTRPPSVKKRSVLHHRRTQQSGVVLLKIFTHGEPQ